MTEPSLVAFYDIWPRNGAGPFLQPRSPHGAVVDKERAQQVIAVGWHHEGHPAKNLLQKHLQEYMADKRQKSCFSQPYVWLPSSLQLCQLFLAKSKHTSAK